MNARVLDCICNCAFHVRTRYQFFQLRRILRAAALRPGKYELLRVRLEDRNHFLELLVGHRAKDDPHAFRMELREERGERLRCRNIVSAVEKKTSDPFQAARPFRRVDALNDIVSGNS